MRFTCLILFTMAACTVFPSAVQADDVISYRRHVWPILKRHCFAFTAVGNLKGSCRWRRLRRLHGAARQDLLWFPGSRGRAC